MLMLIIDGGNSTWVRDLGYTLCPKIWSTSILNDYPDIISKVHQDFIDAGSQFITTFNYSCTPYYQKKKYFDLKKNIIKAGKIAHSMKIKNPDIKVLGCLPPYSESYRVDLIPSNLHLKEFYRNMINYLFPYVDIFICETLTSLREVKILSEVLKESMYKPFWVSFTINNTDTLRDGTDLRLLPSIVKNLGASALLFNCSPINTIDSALEYVKDSIPNDIILGAYPNKHINTIDENFILENEFKVSNNKYLDITPEKYRAILQKWRDCYNVKIIGGCCGITPEYIKELTTLR